jgi:hypothetical protein
MYLLDGAKVIRIIGLAKEIANFHPKSLFYLFDLGLIYVKRGQTLFFMLEPLLALIKLG